MCITSPLLFLCLQTVLTSYPGSLQGCLPCSGFGKWSGREINNPRSGLERWVFIPQVFADGLLTETKLANGACVNLWLDWPCPPSPIMTLPHFTGRVTVKSKIHRSDASDCVFCLSGRQQSRRVVQYRPGLKHKFDLIHATKGGGEVTLCLTSPLPMGYLTPGVSNLRTAQRSGIPSILLGRLSEISILQS